MSDLRQIDRPVSWRDDPGEFGVSGRSTHSPSNDRGESDHPFDEGIRIRDRFQLEMKLYYPLGQDAASSTYDLECYVFIPQSLGIHRASYSKAQFYDDLQAHIRLKTPRIALSAISSEDGMLLSKLKARAARLAEDAGETSVAWFEYRIKLFCCVLKSALRDFVSFVSDTHDPEDRKRLIAEFLRGVTTATSGFRKLRSLIVLPTVPAKAQSIFTFADEYVSLLSERHCYEMLKRLRADGDAKLADSQKKAMEVIADEVRYRANRGYRRSLIQIATTSS